MGIIYIFKIVRRVFSDIWLLLLITGYSIPLVWVARCFVFDMWSRMLGPLGPRLMVMPKYFVLFDHPIVIPSIFIFDILDSLVRPKITAVVFEGFIFKRHLLNHSVAKSVCFCSWMAARFACFCFLYET